MNCAVSSKQLVPIQTMDCLKNSQNGTHVLQSLLQAMAALLESGDNPTKPLDTITLRVGRRDDQLPPPPTPNIQDLIATFVKNNQLYEASVHKAYDLFGIKFSPL